MSSSKCKKVAVLVMDSLIFESLNNDNLYKYLPFENSRYFFVLWTSTLINNQIENIPCDTYIHGLRNGGKPYRYLRMHLRRFHPSVLCLPVVIVDFERNFLNSRFGYDMCINIDSIVYEQFYNKRQISVFDTKRLFLQITEFVQKYTLQIPNVVTEETINSNSIVLTSNELLQHVTPCNYTTITKKRANTSTVDKQCVLVVSPFFFSIYQNVQCAQLREFLNTCHIVVWSESKSLTRTEIKNFIDTMRSTYGFDIKSMLFGLDSNVKSIKTARRLLKPTVLPFVIIDNLTSIYGDERSLCDFDYYINLQEFYVRYSYYDMASVVEKIKLFLKSLITFEKLKITECCPQSDDISENCTSAVTMSSNSSGRRTNSRVCKALENWRRLRKFSGGEDGGGDGGYNSDSDCVELIPRKFRKKSKYGL